jgi:hypothetical protein
MAHSIYVAMDFIAGAIAGILVHTYVVPTVKRWWARLPPHDET